jgi:hypothetical protein
MYKSAWKITRKEERRSKVKTWLNQFGAILRTENLAQSVLRHIAHCYQYISFKNIPQCITVSLNFMNDLEKRCSEVDFNDLRYYPRN